MKTGQAEGRAPHAEMLELRRWNTPTIYNGREQVTRHDAGRDGFNLEEATDFMPQMGAMVGRAVTVVCEPSNRAHPQNNPDAWSQYRRYVASVAGPKIVVVQDLGKPRPSARSGARSTATFTARSAASARSLTGRSAT